MKSRTVNVKTPKGMIQATYGPVRVTDVREHKWRDDVAQAELRQSYTKHYPSARANNSLTDALYDQSEFGFSSSDFEQERVCWINIPLGKTKQDVEKQLEKFEEATIYRIIADNVEQVLSAEQLFAIDSPDFDYSLEKAANSHVVALPDEDGIPVAISKFKDANNEAIMLPDALEVDENGKVTAILKPEGLQYQSKGFSLTAVDDTDLRVASLSPELEAMTQGKVVDEAKVKAL